MKRSKVKLFLPLATCLAVVLPAVHSSRGQEPEEEEKDPEPYRVLHLTGGANHSYSRRAEILRKGLDERIPREIVWTVLEDFSGRSDVKIPGIERLSGEETFDLILHDHCFSQVRDTEYLEKILAPHRSGAAALILHASLWSFPGAGDSSAWEHFTGVHLPGESRWEELELDFDEGGEGQPGWNGPERWPHDEWYPVAVRDRSVVTWGTATGVESEMRSPVVWCHEYGPEKARVFATSLGNQTRAVADSAFLDLVGRGMLWALDSSEELKKGKDQGAAGFVEEKAPMDSLRLGSGIAMQGRAAELSSEDRGDEAALAVDGDTNTAWRAGSPGPAVWSLQFARAGSISAAAVRWLDADVPDVLVEYTSDGLRWIPFPDFDSFVEDGNEGVRLWRFPEPVDATGVRLSFLSSRPGEIHGLREMALYRSNEEIPSRFDIGNPNAGSDGLRSWLDSGQNHDIRIADGWAWGEVGEVPAQREITDWFETAAGHLFLIGQRKGEEERVIWLGKKGVNGYEWQEFLPTTFGSEPLAVFWDGEWLGVLSGRDIARYRDSDGDGKADEKGPVGSVSIPASTFLRCVSLEEDGYCYGILSPESGAKPAEQLVRFPRNGGGIETLYSSADGIREFWLDSPGRIFLVEAGKTIPRQLFPLETAEIRRLRSRADSAAEGVPRGAVAHPGEWLFVRNGDRIGAWSRTGFDGKRESDHLREIAEVPQLRFVSGTGRRAHVLFERKGRIRQAILRREQGPVEFVDLDRISNQDLPGFLDAPSSQVRKEAIYELFRRKRDLTPDVLRVGGDFSRPGKIARLAYLSQLPSEQSLGLLTSAATGELARVSFALLETHSSAKNFEVFREILEIDDPEVTSQILASLERTGSEWEELNEFIYEWTKNESPVLAATATSYLIRNRLFSPVWKDLAEGGDPSHALELITLLEGDEVVDQLLTVIDESSDPAFQIKGLRALAVVYRLNRESQQDGRKRILAFFRQSLRDERFAPDFLFDTMAEYGIPPGDLPFLIALAERNLSFEPYVVARLEEEEVIPEAIPFLVRVTGDESRDSLLRVRARILLLRAEEIPEKEFLSIPDTIVPLVASRGMEEEILRLWIDALVERNGIENLGEWISHLESDGVREQIWEAMWMRLVSADSPPGYREEFSEQLLRAAEENPVRLAEVLGFASSRKEAGKPTGLETPGVSGNEGKDPGKESGEEPVPDPSGERVPDLLVEELKQWVRSAFSGIPPASANDPADFEAWVRQLDSMTPEPGKGWKTFHESRCSACHNIHREGVRIGPDILSAVHTLSTRQFLEVFHDRGNTGRPSKRAQQLELVSGSILTGWVLEEGEKSVHMIDLAGNVFSIAPETIHRNLGSTGPPMGIKGERRWRVDELASLRSFLRGLSP